MLPCRIECFRRHLCTSCLPNELRRPSRNLLPRAAILSSPSYLPTYLPPHIMEDCIDLDDFTLSSPDLGISLSVSSHLYTTHHFTQRTTCGDVRHLVQSGELGFLPPNVCHLQIIVLFAGSPVEEADPDSGFLEFLSHSICSSEVSCSFTHIGVSLLIWRSFGKGSAWR